MDERQQRTAQVRTDDFSLRVEIDFDDQAVAKEQAELSKTLSSMIKLMGWFMLFESFDGD